MQEVIIHSGLCHTNVVALHGNFEDLENVYVVLELCARRSLMEMQKRRCQVTEPEARYFCHQVRWNVLVFCFRSMQIAAF